MLFIVTVICEYSHTPQELDIIGVPEEAKAYGIEYVLSERMGDERRQLTIEHRYDDSKPDPFNQLGNGHEIFWDSVLTMRTLYGVIDKGGRDAKKAREMVVEFISKDIQPKDYLAKAKAFSKASQ